MPYFKWVGVDITGAIKKGKKSAISLEDLSARLLCQGIALLSSKSVYTPSFVWSITAKVKSDLFEQKAKLLRAGVLLPNALEVMTQQSHNPIMYDILVSIGRDIQQGVSLGKALEKHSVLHDPMVVIMLAAGHESGNIITAVENVAIYFHKQHIFNKNLRAALAMPFLTLLFFMGISFFIFVFIIPRFAEMFSSLQQALPPVTQCMISISHFMVSYSMLYVSIGIILTIICLHRYCTTRSGRNRWNSIINYTPYVGTIIWQYHMCQSFQALALLVASGVPLVTGLKIVSESIDHETIKIQLQDLYHDVAGGQLLSAAMATTAIFLPEIIALVYVGEESGTLDHSLEAAALVYNERGEQSLRRFIFFLQPCVIVVLGLLVTILIFAVYSPIMQLSHVI